MERNLPPPPRGYGAPPVQNAAHPQPFARRNKRPAAFEAPPRNEINEQSAPPPPPQQLHAPQSFGFPMARGPVYSNAGAPRRGWKPGRVGGRHDSPLYGKHRKRPASSSIDSNVSWSGSEIESVGGSGTAHGDQEQVSRLSWASSIATSETFSSAAPQDLSSAASLFGTTAVEQHATKEQKTQQALESKGGMDVHPPKTPLGKPTIENDGGMSATQRVRLELSTHAGSLAGSRTNSSENVFASTAYDEEKNGPQSCPLAFDNTRQPQFSIDKLRQLRSNELVASKLLPTRTSVNSLMGYVRELQLSEATLRKQLVKTKQHTEKELSQSLSKVNELERTMMEVERDRMLARQKLEEQEKVIRDLAAKLKQAENAKASDSTLCSFDELPFTSKEATLKGMVEEKAFAEETKRLESTALPLSTSGPSLQSTSPLLQQNQDSAPPVYLQQLKSRSDAFRFGLASPRSPNQPLWDPWASGGATPMKNLPPVFTIGSTALDQVAALSSSTTPTSAIDGTLTATGEYELKSVLLSPRRVHDRVENAKDECLSRQTGHDESTTSAKNSSAALNVGLSPPLYLDQANSSSLMMPHEKHGTNDQEQELTTKTTTKDVMTHPTKSTAPADECIDEQQEMSGISESRDVLDVIAEGNESQAKQKGPSLVRNTLDINKDVASHLSPRPQAITEIIASKSPAIRSENSQSTRSEHALDSGAASGIASMPSALSVGNYVSTTSSASPIQEDDKDVVQLNPVSLEALLVDFFNEVDQKRLKMATVYGKRYAGREKWLFTELTKRYGAAKVATLKARFESGTAAISMSNSDNSNKKDGNTAKLSNVSDHSKTSRQGHPRHPQFFNPSVPASDANVSAVSSPSFSHSPRESNALKFQPQRETERTETRLSSSAEDHGSHAPQRRSGGNVPLSPGPPPPLLSSQEKCEDDAVIGAASDGKLMVNEPSPAQFSKIITGQNQVETQENYAASLGLRQRHQKASGMSIQDQKNEFPAVTLEGLLRELYKHHQPDKLKNASIVAKQYTGKERELVGLLKGKYGALSVKRLEENLEVLEQAHRACTGSKIAHKKRGFFVCTISLLFWLSVLLYLSIGAVIVSFAVIDAWECRAFSNDEQDSEFAEDCASLKQELKKFTFERVADYVSQSHPNACFCSEWSARQSSLFTNFSGNDLVGIARLVPFSPDSFGTPWIASVKEQIPSQEFYDSYAKPVVDLSLSVGSFLWFSALELSGYGDDSEININHAENVKNDATGISSVEFVERVAEQVNNENEVEARAQRPEALAATKNKSEVMAGNWLFDEHEVVAKGDMEAAHQLPARVEVAATGDVEGEGEDVNELATTEDMENESEFEAGLQSHDKGVVANSGDVGHEREVEAGHELPGEDDMAVTESAVKEREDEVRYQFSDDKRAVNGFETYEIGSMETFIKESQTDEIGTAANVENLDETAVPTEKKLFTIDNASFPIISEPEESFGLIEAVDVLELHETLTYKELELVNTEEARLADAVNREADILIKNDAVFTPVNEPEFVDRDDVKLSQFSDDQQVEFTNDALEQGPKTASIEVNVSSAEDSIQSDNVVEVEVLQKNSDLLYSEKEAYVPVNNQTADFTDNFLSVNLESSLSDQSLDIEGDVSSETNSEVISEVAHGSVDSGMQKFESVNEEISRVSSPYGADVEAKATEIEADDEFLSKAVQVETSDVENANTIFEKDEAEAEERKVDDLINVEEAANLEYEVIAFKDGHTDEVVEKNIVVQQDLELFEGSKNVDVAVALFDDSNVGNSNEAIEVNYDGKEITDFAASSSADARIYSKIANMDMFKSEAVLSEIDTKPLNPAESALSLPSELTVDVLEPIVVGNMEETEGDDDKATLSARIASNGVSDTPNPDPRIDVEVEGFDNDRGEEGEGDSGDVESIIPNLVEVDHSVSEVEVYSDTSVAIEAKEVLIGPESGFAEIGDETTKQINDVENAGASVANEAKIIAAEDSKTANALEEKAHFDDNDAMLDSTGVADENALSNSVADESSPLSNEEGVSGGLVVAVNEVLARLVEPFEAAKADAATKVDEKV